MMVCICNAIREKDFLEAVRDGAQRPAQVFAHFGHQPKCGHCHDHARALIEAGRAPA